MSEHASYRLEIAIGTQWGTETLEQPDATDLTDDGTANPVIVGRGGKVVAQVVHATVSQAGAWAFSNSGFGSKLSTGLYTWGSSTISGGSVHPTESFAALCGTGNGSDALKIVEFTAAGFGDEVDSTLDGADGDEVSGCEFHPGGEYLFHWGSLTAVGIHDFDPVAGTLSNFTDLSSTYGATVSSAMWHPDGDYLAVFTGESPFLYVHPFTAGSFGTALTLPAGFTGDVSGTFRGAAWSPDGTRLAAAWDSGTYVFDLSAGALTLAFESATLFYNLNWVDDSWIVYRTASSTNSTFALAEIGDSAVLQTLTSQTTFTDIHFSSLNDRYGIANGWIIYPTSSSPFIASIHVSGSFLDVAGDVIDQGGVFVSCTRGRFGGRQFSAPEAGELAATILNTDGTYDADDLPGRHIRLVGEYGGEDYPLWYGYITETALASRGLEPLIHIRAHGRLGMLVDTSVVTDLHFGVFAHEAVGLCLDAVGWPEEQRALEESWTYLWWFWGAGQSAMDLIQQIASVDGVGSTFFVDGNGNFIYRSASARWEDTESTVSQATFSTSPTSDPAMYAPIFKPKRNNVVNRAEMRVEHLGLDSDTTVIWTGDTVYGMQPDAPLVIKAVLDTPADDIITPVEATDYVIHHGTVDAVSIDRTSGQVITITFSGDASIKDLQLRGKSATQLPPSDFRSRQVVNTSVNRFGVRDWEPQNAPWPYISWGPAQDLVESVVNRYRDGVPTFSLGFAANHTSTAMTKAMTFDLMTRVTVNETVVGKSGDYWIERIVHTIRSANWHTVDLELEQVTETNPNQTTYTEIEQAVNPTPTPDGEATSLMALMVAV